jgi:hypothetical protein
MLVALTMLAMHTAHAYDARDALHIAWQPPVLTVTTAARRVPEPSAAAEPRVGGGRVRFTRLCGSV